MEILFKRAFKLDNPTFQVNEINFTSTDSEFDNYITEIINEVANDQRTKKYNFPNDTTALKQILTNDGLFNGNEIDILISFSQRLIREEIFAQDNFGERLGVEIQKGILIYALTQSGNYNNFFVIKAEQLSVINEDNKKIAQALPVKKKIYKSSYAVIDQDRTPYYAMVGDSKSTISKYWWHGFLELTEEKSDSYNTTHAFDAIETVLKRERNKSKEDYFALRNATIHYFRSKRDFVLEDFISDIINPYIPTSDLINVNDLSEKIRLLPKKRGFDGRFTIITGDLKKRVYTLLKLTPQLELTIKEEINTTSDVLAFKNGEDKFIQIRTDNGYDHFKKLENGNH